MKKDTKTISRRKFIDTSVKATLISSIAFNGFPTIVPSSVFGKNAPSEKINIGQIGFGRIAMTHDLPETLKYDIARVVAGKNSKSLDASDPKILASIIKENDIHLYTIDNQHGNWLDCIKSREEPISPVEKGHRACTVCLITHIAMKLGRKLIWNPEKEIFVNDNEANSMLSRTQRAPYGTDYIKM